MRFTRRRILLLGLLGSLWASVGRLFGKTEATAEIDLQVLERWVETLLPTDAVSPGAGKLGVHAELLRIARKDPRAERLLILGLAWLSGEAIALGSRSFTDLSLDDCERIVAKAASMERTEMARVFFAYTLRISKELYYAKPEAWAGLGLQRPPQPMGYMDYREAPR